MTALPKIDDRIENRVELSGMLPACFRGEADGATFSGLLLNLSTHGLMIRTAAAVPPGTVIEMLTLAGSVFLSAQWTAPTTGSAWASGLKCERDVGALLSLLH